MSAAKVGLLAVVVIAVGTFLGFTKDVPFLNEPYEIRAAFRDASGMRSGSPVRIAGIDVGEVTKVEHTQPGARSAVATLAIRERGRPIHRDATAKIRPRIFLEGNFFVDLTPGSPGAPEFDDGGTIPASRTANPVQVGEILKALKRDTRQDLKKTLNGLAEAQKAGAGKAFNETLPFQAPAYKYSAIVSEALLGQRPGDLGRWIRNMGVVSSALDANPRQLKALITDFNTTAAAVADREAELRRAVRVLPETIDDGMAAFADLNAAFPSVRRFASASVPAVRSTPEAVDATVPLLRQLRLLFREQELKGTARDLRRAIPPLTEVAEESVPLLEENRRLASCTSNVLVPVGNDKVPDPNFPATGPVHAELPKGFVGLAGESRSFDANGQWFKVLGTGGVETFDLGNNLLGITGRPILGVNPPPDRTTPPYRPEVPCETQERPNLDTKPMNPPARVDTDPNSDAVQERLRKAQALATAVLQATLDLEGDPRTIREDSLTSGELSQLREELGR